MGREGRKRERERERERERGGGGVVENVRFTFGDMSNQPASVCLCLLSAVSRTSLCLVHHPQNNNLQFVHKPLILHVGGGSLTVG